MATLALKVSRSPRKETLLLGMIPAKKFTNGATRKVSLKRTQDERGHKERLKMELLFGLGSMMAIMITSLILQHTSYRRLKVTLR